MCPTHCAGWCIGSACASAGTRSSPPHGPTGHGLLLSSALFGALHNSGGRNWSFAAWASAVGRLYGAAYLYTHYFWVPAGAHALANCGFGLLWRWGNPEGCSSSSRAGRDQAAYTAT